MTERFKFICDDENCYFKDNDKAIDCYEAVELLNTLNDENEQLKKDCSILVQSNQEYRKENEQLKQRIKVLKDTIDGLTGTIAHFDLDEVMLND